MFGDCVGREREKKRLIQGAEEGESLRDVVGNSHSSVDVKERQLVGMDGEMVVVDWVDEPPAHEVLGQNIVRWCQTHGNQDTVCSKRLRTRRWTCADE